MGELGPGPGAAAREAGFGARVRLGCGLQASSYGFAYGLMASRVAQFGPAVLVALAAGGFRRQDRAQVGCCSLHWRLAVLLGRSARRFSHCPPGWRLAVLLGKSARRSESLRTRHAGGWRQRLVGA